MKTIAYLANSFPEPGEPYVWEEICELRNAGCTVFPYSFRRRRKTSPDLARFASETIYIFPQCWRLALSALLLLATKFHSTVDLIERVVRGREALNRRLRTLLHTWMGACLAVSLRKKNIQHIHIHHGYFSSWSGMVAARLLGKTFSVTLHGSDLLVRADYLDCKLRECHFAITVSEFNRNYILQKCPGIDPNKIVVRRLGVDVDYWQPRCTFSESATFRILSVGRLHAVKNHEFLLRACGELKQAGVDFQCVIAGDGSKRANLEALIRSLELSEEVQLLGHVPREQLPELYSHATVVVFTSRSEGIPLAAMEAMAMECVVLAPAITGIPELIIHAETGFLYEPNSMPDFLAKLMAIQSEMASLKQLRNAARGHVVSQFNREHNLKCLTQDFLRRIGAKAEDGESIHAHPVLQQI